MVVISNEIYCIVQSLQFVGSFDLENFYRELLHVLLIEKSFYDYEQVVKYNLFSVQDTKH